MVVRNFETDVRADAPLGLQFFYAFGVYVAWKIVVVEVDFAVFQVDFCSVVDRGSV